MNPRPACIPTFSIPSRLIAGAASRAQIWLVTHSEPLAEALASHGGITPRKVVKHRGATRIEGLTIAGELREEGE
jgi:predicted ATPase